MGVEQFDVVKCYILFKEKPDLVNLEVSELASKSMPKSFFGHFSNSFSILILKNTHLSLKRFLSIVDKSQLFLNTFCLCLFQDFPNSHCFRTPYNKKIFKKTLLNVASFGSIASNCTLIIMGCSVSVKRYVS